MTPHPLERLGFGPDLASAFAPLESEGLAPGRVVSGHQRLHRVAAAGGELLAELAGSLRHAARGPEDLPAVGDWVALRLRAGERRALIQAVLPRRTAFLRRAAGDRSVAQVLAANVDTAFLVMGLDADFSSRRLERALVLAWESGAQPVVLLNKADLCAEVAARRGEAEASAPGLPVLVIGAKSGDGMDALSPWLLPGRTVVLLGSSGVGKSTIVNRLLGHERQRTREVRAHDQRGRHTTTRRELIELPGGALLVDTPGLREVQLWAEDTALEAAFADLMTLAAGCRFGDCAHQGEPGCAVREAVEAGRLDSARLLSFHRLQAELRSLEIREDPLLRRRERGRWKAIYKSLRQAPKG